MVRIPLPLLLAAAGLATCSGCQNTPTHDPVETSRRAEQTATLPGPLTWFRTFDLSPRGWKVEVPSKGYQFRHRTFTRPTSPTKIKERLTILRDNRTPVVALDIWENPQKLPLAGWFSRNLDYLLFNDSTLEKTVGTRHRTEVWIVDQPRSPQSRAMRTAVFAADDWILRITCLDSEDPEAVQIFQRALASFRAGEVKP